jgi:hypothetical protein
LVEGSSKKKAASKINSGSVGETLTHEQYLLWEFNINISCFADLSSVK